MPENEYNVTALGRMAASRLKTKRSPRMAVARTLAFLCMIGISLTLPPRTTAGDQPQPSTTDRVIRDTKEAVEATKQYTLQQKETFQKAVQAELAEMQVKIAELQKKTHAASAEARTEMQKALQELEHKKAEAGKQLEEVNASTSSAWSKLKDNMNAAVEDLKKSYTETVSKLP
jgi:Skp family chaperone for outer membrane proteins